MERRSVQIELRLLQVRFRQGVVTVPLRRPAGAVQQVIVNRPYPKSVVHIEAYGLVVSRIPYFVPTQRAQK